MRQIAILGALLVSACASSMVSSEAPSSTTPADSRLLGEYGLAQTMFTVTISAGGGGEAKEGDKAAGVVVNNNYSPTVERPKDAEAAKGAAPARTETSKAPESEAAFCADLRKTYNQDRLALLAFAQQHNDFTARLRGWIAKGTYAEADRIKIVRAVEAYVAAKRAKDQALDRATLNIVLMGRDRNGDAPGTEPHCPQKFKVDIKETTEVDTSQTFRLYAKIDNFSADRWVAEFDGGLPKSVSGTADHKFGDIAVAAAKSIASIQALGVAPATPLRLVSGPNEAFDAAVEAIRKGPIDAGELQGLLNALPEPETLDPIDVPLPYQRIYTVADLAGRITFVHHVLPVALSTTCSSTAGSQSGPISGVAISASRACEVVVLAPEDYAHVAAAAAEHAKNAEAARKANKPEPEARSFQPTYPYLARAKVWALDSQSIVSLPLDRTTLIKTTTAYTFTAGRATKADFDRPAPLLEVASLPFKVIGAFTGAMVDGLKGETGKVEAVTARTKAETAQIEAAEALATARKEAMEADADPEPASAPVP